MAAKEKEEIGVDTAAEEERRASILRDTLRTIRQDEERRKIESAAINTDTASGKEAAQPNAAQDKRTQLADEYNKRNYGEPVANGQQSAPDRGDNRIEVSKLVAEQLRGNERTVQGNEYEQIAKQKRGVDETTSQAAERDNEFKGKEFKNLKDEYKEARAAIRGSGSDEKNDLDLAKNNDFSRELRTGRSKKEEFIVPATEENGQEKDLKYVREASRFSPDKNRTQQYEKVTKTDENGTSSEAFELKREMVGRDNGAKREYEYGERGKTEDGKDFREVTVSKFDNNGQLRERYQAKQIIKIDEKDGQKVEIPQKDSGGRIEETDIKLLDKVDRRGRVVLETKENTDGEREVTRNDYNLLSTRKTVNRETDIVDADGSTKTVGRLAEKEITGVRGKYNYKFEETENGSVETRKREGGLGGLLDYEKQTNTTRRIDDATGDVKAEIITETKRNAKVAGLVAGEGVSKKEIEPLEAVKNLSEKDLREKFVAAASAEVVSKKLPESEVAKELEKQTREDFNAAVKTHATAFKAGNETAQDAQKAAYNKTLEDGAKDFAKIGDDNVKLVAALRAERPEGVDKLEKESSDRYEALLDRIEIAATEKRVAERIGGKGVDTEKLEDKVGADLREADFIDRSLNKNFEAQQGKAQRDADASNRLEADLDKMDERINANVKERLGEDYLAKKESYEAAANKQPITTKMTDIATKVLGTENAQRLGLDTKGAEFEAARTNAARDFKGDELTKLEKGQDESIIEKERQQLVEKTTSQLMEKDGKNQPSLSEFSDKITGNEREGPTKADDKSAAPSLASTAATTSGSEKGSANDRELPKEIVIKSENNVGLLDGVLDRVTSAYNSAFNKHTQATQALDNDKSKEQVQENAKQNELTPDRNAQNTNAPAQVDQPFENQSRAELNQHLDDRAKDSVARV